jgi:lipoyl(octanoyl) transferase
VTEFIHIFRNSIAESIDSIWGISVIDNPESPGLYLSENPEKKIVSFGIYFKSFFTSFGAAVNIDNSLNTFSVIHPCGGKSENITSIQLLGKDTKLKRTFCETIREDLVKVLK